MSELNEEGQELTVQDYNQETGEVTLVDDAGNITVVKIVSPTSQTNLSEEVGGRRKRKNKSKKKRSNKKSMRRRK
jgi:hypothetical protein